MSIRMKFVAGDCNPYVRSRFRSVGDDGQPDVLVETTVSPGTTVKILLCTVLSPISRICGDYPKPLVQEMADALNRTFDIATRMEEIDTNIKDAVIKFAAQKAREEQGDFSAFLKAHGLTLGGDEKHQKEDQP